VISAILHIYQDLDETPNWPMEVVGNDKIQQDVKLEAGEMLLLESARVITGRATPFIGNSYVQVAFHFKPASGWAFSRQLDVERVNGPDNNADGNALLSGTGTFVPLHPVEETRDFWLRANPDSLLVDTTPKDEL
jgi:hypothetical protein